MRANTSCTHSVHSVHTHRVPIACTSVYVFNHASHIPQQARLHPTLHAPQQPLIVVASHATLLGPPGLLDLRL